MQAQDAAAGEIPEPGFKHNQSLEIEPERKAAAAHAPGLANSGNSVADSPRGQEERAEAVTVRVETQSPAPAAVAVEDEWHQSPAAADQPALADDDQHPADTTTLEESQAQFLPGIGLRLTPEMSRRFAEESSELCDEAEMAILGLEKAVDDELASQAFRAFHSIKGNAGFFGYGDIEKLSHLAENLLDDVRERRRTCDGVAMSVLLSTIDALRNKVTGTAGGENPEIPNFQQLCESLEKIMHAPGLDQVADPVPDRVAEAQAPEQVAEAPGLDSVETGCAPPQGLAGQHDTEHGLEEAGRSASGGRPGSSHENSPPVPKGSNSQPLEPATKSALPTGSRTGGQKRGDAGDASPGRGDADDAGSASGAKQQASGNIQQVIRVDIDKLDKLLDLVGELVIAEAMVTNDGRVEVHQDDRFGKAFLQLDKISREIQEVAMSMRMIPLAGVFRRMLRLVRDLANKADKQVELEIIGEETEVDKTIIEQISDPLVHLIRNAVDHGIESVAERQRAGKPDNRHGYHRGQALGRRGMDHG